MYFKNGKKLHINNSLAYQLINMEINWSVTYVKNSLTDIKKIFKQIIFLTQKIQTTCTNKFLPHLLRIVMIRDFCYMGELRWK